MATPQYTTCDAQEGDIIAAVDFPLLLLIVNQSVVNE